MGWCGYEDGYDKIKIGDSIGQSFRFSINNIKY